MDISLVRACSDGTWFSTASFKSSWKLELAFPIIISCNCGVMLSHVLTHTYDIGAQVKRKGVGKQTQFSCASDQNPLDK